MTRRDDAIKAAGLALHCDACTNDGHDGCDTSDWDREAETALDAALAVLQPVVPNTAEALDRLPDGTVLGAVGTHNAPCTLTIMDHTNPTEAADFWTFCGVTTWTVLWWGDNKEDQ